MHDYTGEFQPADVPAPDFDAELTAAYADGRKDESEEYGPLLIAVDEVTDGLGYELTADDWRALVKALLGVRMRLLKKKPKADAP